MKINELFKEEYIGKKVIDNSEEGIVWIIQKNTLITLSSINDLDIVINDYYTTKYILELEFEFIEEKTGWERVKEGDRYFKIDCLNLTIYITEKNRMYDNSAYNSVNYFSTKEKAQEVADMQLELRKTLKFLDESDTENAQNNKKALLKLIKDLRENLNIEVIMETQKEILGEYGKIKSRNCEELEKKLSPLFEGLIRGFRE